MINSQTTERIHFLGNNNKRGTMCEVCIKPSLPSHYDIDKLTCHLLILDFNRTRVRFLAFYPTLSACKAIIEQFSLPGERTRTHQTSRSMPNGSNNEFRLSAIKRRCRLNDQEKFIQFRNQCCFYQDTIPRFRATKQQATTWIDPFLRSSLLVFNRQCPFERVLYQGKDANNGWRFHLGRRFLPPTSDKQQTWTWWSLKNSTGVVTQNTNFLFYYVCRSRWVGVLVYLVMRRTRLGFENLMQLVRSLTSHCDGCLWPTMTNHLL